MLLPGLLSQLYLNNRGLFSVLTKPHLNTRGVGRILDSYANPRRSRLSRIFPTPRMFRWDYVNTEESHLLLL